MSTCVLSVRISTSTLIVIALLCVRFSYTAQHSVTQYSTVRMKQTHNTEQLTFESVFIHYVQITSTLKIHSGPRCGIVDPDSQHILCPVSKMR